MKGIKIENRAATGGSSKGQERIKQILLAARKIMVDSGYHSLSMRKVASELGITVGNVHYYYPNKKDLLRDMVDTVVIPYTDIFDNVWKTSDHSPEERFVEIVNIIIDDIGTKETTHFFPELWAMANHDEYAAEQVDQLYARARRVLNDLIKVINPALTESSRQQVALFISSSMEGLTPFAGYKKPWASKTPNLKRIASKSFLDLVQNISNEDIKG